MDNLAIIIPYYKLIFFEETLASLAAQTDKRFKVYIGDDASPEDCSGLLEKYKGEFDFEYYRFQENQGSISLIKQWERCIALSGDEDWMMILGDDDYLESNVVESFYKHFENFQNKTNLVRFASKIFRQESNVFSETYAHPIWEKASDSYFRKFQFLTMSSLSEYIFKRESYAEFKFKDFPLAWYSDDMAWLEFSDNQKIYTINEAVVVFRFSNYNISGKGDNIVAKEEAKFLFYKKLIKNQLYLFDAFQRKKIVLEFGITAIAQKRLNFTVFSMVALKLLKNGSLYAFAKFIRRIAIAKYRNIEINGM